MDPQSLLGVLTAFTRVQRQMLLTLEVLVNDNKRLPYASYDTRRTFAILCHLLRTIIGISSIEIVDVEEMVVMFLHILAHDVKNHVIQREFIQSGETVSRHFNLVLLDVVRLHDELLKKPVTNNCTDPVENCFGALDGTYIKVNMPTIDRPTFRMCKEEIATNVLDVCDTKGDFVYVSTDWEGFHSRLVDSLGCACMTK
ncbi:putative nuclease HARBI1 [Cucumis melo var. makuwa]|uniref:Nuclease HARBI1 n=1 Tax=Cucumis melo var. makuwa TaxID=1194695 RepID=A0A5D3BPM2_CUCMM|nr:putative nuclease HARBI1 [Cucumis melo var. makuwa]TYK01267.1 putative nuclease HARBI1 [Cucumis melo var. makuwa]